MAKDKVREEPQAIEAERAVLGSMILERDAIGRVMEILSDGSFYLDAHRRIYLAIIKLYDQNEPVDLVTLANGLKKKKELKSVGEAGYLAEILDNVVSSANVEHYAKIVRNKATLRDMIKACNRIIEAGYEEQEEVDEMLDKAEHIMFNIKERRIEKGFIPIKSILMPGFELMEKLSEKKEYVTGIPSSFTELDNLTSGFQSSDLIVVAGRPSMGKTSFCLNVAEEVAISHEQGVGIFSLEMSKEQVAMRMLCSQARVSSRRVRTPAYLEKSDWPKLTRAAGTLYEAPIFIDDTPGLPVLDLRAKARRLKSRYDIKLLIVDYLQLMSGPSRSENRQQEISAISRSLKELAKELAIPIIAVSQLSRAPETRGGVPRPRLSDLRESGAIEQDADVVLFVYRDEVYRRTPENEGLASIIIGKQRNGPTGEIKLAFIKEYTRFENLARTEMSPIEDETAVE